MLMEQKTNNREIREAKDLHFEKLRNTIPRKSERKPKKFK